jgi:hypothetical protein
MVFTKEQRIKGLKGLIAYNKKKHRKTDKLEAKLKQLEGK